MESDQPTPTTPLRVATWNLNHWRQPLLPIDTRRCAWAHLADRIGAQVALVQEAVPPADLQRDRVVYGEIAGHRNWGSAVVALDPAIAIEPIRSVRNPWSSRRYLLDASHPGSTAVARLTAPGIHPITLVSIYGVIDRSSLASMHRAVADLLPLFDSPDGARVILGGDLNVAQTSKDAQYLARADALLAAVEALGLVEAKTVVAVPPSPAADCACGNGGSCGHIGTWNTSGGPAPPGARPRPRPRRRAGGAVRPGSGRSPPWTTRRVCSTRAPTAWSRWRPGSASWARTSRSPTRRSWSPRCARWPPLRRRDPVLSRAAGSYHGRGGRRSRSRLRPSWKKV